MSTQSTRGTLFEYPGGSVRYENVKDMYRHVDEMIDEFSGGKLSAAARQQRVKGLFARQCARARTHARTHTQTNELLRNTRACARAHASVHARSARTNKNTNKCAARAKA